MKRILIVGMAALWLNHPCGREGEFVQNWSPGQEQNPRVTLEGHGEPVLCVAFSPDGRTLASGSVDKTIKFWDANSGKNTATLVTAFPDKQVAVRAVAFSPTLKTLASAGPDNAIGIWQVETGKNIATFGTRNGSGYVAAFGPDGKTLVSVYDSEIRLWDVASGTMSAKLIGHRGYVFSAVLSKDGKTLVSGGFMDNTIRFWDVGTRKNTATIENCQKHGVTCVAISPDGKLLASGGKDYGGKSPLPTALEPRSARQGKSGTDGTIKLWDISSGKNTAMLLGHESQVHGLVFSPDGKTLASGGRDQTVRLWDVATAKSVATLRGHTGDVPCVAFSPDGKTIASCSLDKTIRLWDLPPGKSK